MCKISRPYLNYWTWTKTAPQTKWFFLSNPYKIEVLTTSLIEMLELPNFGHITTSTIWFESCDEILLMISCTKIITSDLSYQNIFILRGFRVAIFTDIIKILTMSIKTNFKDLKKV